MATSFTTVFREWAFQENVVDDRYDYINRLAFRLYVNDK